IDDVRRFIDLSTLGRRMRRTDTLTIEYLNRDKQWRRGRFVASKRDEWGRLVRVLWLSEDINEEKKERDKLLDMSERAIAANEAKSSFLSNVSQEIHTPINRLLDRNETILRESDDRQVLACAEDIRTAGQTLLGIVNDILDYSLIETGRMELLPVDYDLADILADLLHAIRPKAEEKKLKLNLDIDRTLPKRLHGDAVRVRQIILNLLTNAVKYTEKGAVTFTIGYEKNLDETDTVLMDVAVMDTGIGIRHEDMDRIFSKFDRIEGDKDGATGGGAGLGLNITKRLLEMMNAELEVESVYELGSRFSFRLAQQVVSWEPLGDYEACVQETTETSSSDVNRRETPDADRQEPQVAQEEETPAASDELVETLAGCGIDTEAGMKNSGDRETYLELLKIFYDAMDDTTETICRLYEEGDWKNYTIRVHALKSGARTIGAIDFGEAAQALEDAGKAENLDYIRAHHQALMDAYAGFRVPLSALFTDSEPETDRPEADADYVRTKFGELRTAAEDMDCDLLEEIVRELEEYSIPQDLRELYDKLRDAVAEFDYMAIQDLLPV
ncbi:MAG: Hpt domain-containing protein, partial [Butyrivibrio sp.]|nr:Hpt domain-containing protein [Butyrivibrio sp.]